MELSFILFIIGFLLIVYLLFKFIKKIVYAIFSVILLCVLIVGGIGGLIYLDISEMSETSNFELTLVLGTQEQVESGVILPIENNKLVQEKVSSLDVGKYSQDKLDELTSGQYYVFISQDFFYSTLDETTTYTLLGTDEKTEVMGSELDLSFTKQEALSMLESQDAMDVYVDVIYSKNDIPDFLQATAKPLVKAYIEEELSKQEVEFKDAVFISLLISSFEEDSQLALDYIQSYKDEEVMVAPEKFTFKLIKMLPVSLIQSLLEDYLPAQN